MLEWRSGGGLVGQQRLLALMGTDLVEGRMDEGRIREIGRVDLTGQPRR